MSFTKFKNVTLYPYSPSVLSYGLCYKAFLSLLVRILGIFVVFTFLLFSLLLIESLQLPFSFYSLDSSLSVYCNSLMNPLLFLSCMLFFMASTIVVTALYERIKINK
jgi:succinate dehydrogenase/fumarate reductase cytochrome b subunit